MSVSPGSRLGSYVVRSLIGSGGMGEVYLAHDDRLRRDVAVKLMAPRLEQESEAVDRFIREALAVSALNHPNIVTIHETGETPAGRFIVMEFVQGRSLREVIRQGTTIDQARDLARQVAEALAVAHARQIVHRDVKPDNVMVRDDGYVKVLDFGLARVVMSEHAGEATLSAETRTGLVLGTIGYLSPEQARGEAVTTASDVFALGILLYELITGQHPFHAPSPLAVLHAITNDAPVPPSRLGLEVPASLDQLVLECLQKDPRLRPASSEVASRLRGLAGNSESARTLAAPTRSTGRIVGREAETDQLLRAYALTRDGHGRLVAIAGEPGLGKTALVEDFVASVTESGLARVARGRCSERLAGSEAYLPFLEALDNLLRSESHGSLVRVVKSLAPNWYAQVRSSSDGQSAERAMAEAGAGSPHRMKREMAALLEEASRLHPVVLFLEDLHWADASTIDLLGYLADRLSSMRLLIVTTFRPSELSQARHPFLSLKLDLQARGVCEEIALGCLSAEAVRQYVDLEFPGNTFEACLIKLVYERTEGHALFLVDLLRDLKRRHVVFQKDGAWTVAEGVNALQRELPESVRSMIQRKLGALGNSDRQLLSAAAVQGADFYAAVVAQALGLEESVVEDALDRLEREHALVRFVGEHTCPDRTITPQYRFSHVLYQSALADALRPTRRGALAGEIAGAMVQRWADRTPEIALDLAVLFETARAPLAAARYFSVAAQSASRLYAHREAIGLTERGLARIATLPDDGLRRGIELELQMGRALALKTGRGYAVPEVGQAYRRARELSRQVQDPGQVIPALMGLSAHYIAGGEIGVAYELAEQLLEIAGQVNDQHVMMIAEWCVGAALHHKGSLRQAHDHLERALSLYDPAFHRGRAWQVGIEPGIFCSCETARTLMLLDRAHESAARIQRAEDQARALAHPQTLAFVLLFRMLLHHLREEPAAALAVYGELAALCADKGIAQEMLWARPVAGWALFATGERTRGLAEVAAGLAEQSSSHNALLRPYYLQTHAEMLMQERRLDEADALLETSRAVGRDTDQQMFAAEWHRLRGEILLARDRANLDEAQAAFNDALAVARWQGARLFENRARAALARSTAAPTPGSDGLRQNAKA